jgi:ectoine hydroxylase-related dioxygenase (phytanoyl-CoA dioxygenase family)
MVDRPVVRSSEAGFFMAQSTTAALQPPRAVTDTEVAAFRENGWVKLDRLLAPETARALLSRLKQRMGEAAEHPRVTGASVRATAASTMWRNFDHPSRDDDVFESLSHSPEMGQIGRCLLGRPVRFWIDNALVKMPARREGGSVATAWHQDFPAHPLDRSGNAVVWIALDDIPPERGAMRFLSGSQRAGVFGRTVQEGKDLLEIHPDLADEYEMSPPLTYAPGDATVHNSLTVHGASANTTEDPRWVYVVDLFVADALYTGLRHWVTDSIEGLEVNKPFDHPRFPIVG